MAKNSIRDYSATAGSNTDIQSVDIDENCAASGINNAIREVMADLKDVSTGAVALETPAADRLDVDNIRIDGNTISSTDTNGDIDVTPNGSGSLHVTNSGSGDALIVESTDGGDTFAPDIAVYRNTSSPADNDGIGLVSFRGRNDASQDVEYVQIVTGTGDVTDGSENGNFGIKTMVDGTLDNRFVIDNSGNVGIGQSSANQKLDVNGNIVTDSYSLGAGNGIFLRRGFESTAQPSITVADHSGSAPDGLSVNGFDGVSFRTNNIERARFDESGRLLVGATSLSSVTGGSESFAIDGPDGARVFCSRGSTAAREQIIFFNPNGDVGSIDTSGSATSYNTSSDHRLKENVADMTGAIDRVKALAPKRFNFIADADTTVDGFLAHEAQAVVPEAVTGTHNEVDDDGNAVMQGIDQSKLVPLLTAALKESIAKIETLETEMTALKARVTALEA